MNIPLIITKLMEESMKSILNSLILLNDSFRRELPLISGLILANKVDPLATIMLNGMIVKHLITNLFEPLTIFRIILCAIFVFYHMSAEIITTC
jgi:hypothetical protein